MKKILLAIPIAAMLLAGCGSEEAKMPEDTEGKIEWRVKEEYRSTDVDHITLNPNSGTKDKNDKVALIYLIWNVKNTVSTSKEMLNLHSKDLAAFVYENCPEVSEFAVFWEVPYHDGNAKLSFKRKKSGMRLTDEKYLL